VVPQGLRVPSGRRQRQEGVSPFSVALETRMPLVLETHVECGRQVGVATERQRGRLLEAEGTPRELLQASWELAAACCCCGQAVVLVEVWPRLGGSALKLSP